MIKTMYSLIQQALTSMIHWQAAISSKYFEQFKEHQLYHCLIDWIFANIFWNEGRGAQGFVIVCDMGRKETFDSVTHWVEEINRLTDTKNPTIMLLANKKDIGSKATAGRGASEEVQRVHPDILFFEVSARSGHQVEESFKALGEAMFNKGMQRKASGFRITASGSVKVRSGQIDSMRGGSGALGSGARRIENDPRLESPADTACCGASGKR